MFEMDPSLNMRKLKPEEVEGERATLIHAIDDAKFWDLLVKVRSKDWSTFCAGRVKMNGSRHDEL